jgi:hypothetical protein
MHDTYRMLAHDRIDDALREAAAWRLANEAREDRTSLRWPARIRDWVRHAGRGQRAAARSAAAPFPTDAPSCF